ncbi:MAG: hypothetical protein H6Q61_1049, partial [Firmicutes bacterium]|nr:hypothetical protein [Bacillota bacterium]
MIPGELIEHLPAAASGLDRKAGYRRQPHIISPADAKGCHIAPENFLQCGCAEIRTLSFIVQKQRCQSSARKLQKASFGIPA